MRLDTHPAYVVVFRDESAGEAFLSRSALTARAGPPTLEREDGGTYRVVDVDVASASHPFWTGDARVLDTEGRVEEFRRRYDRG